MSLSYWSLYKFGVSIKFLRELKRQVAYCILKQFVHQWGSLITFRASTELRSSIHFLGYGQHLVELWIGLQPPYSCFEFPTQSDNDEVQSSFFACCYSRSRKLELEIGLTSCFLSSYFLGFF